MSDELNRIQYVIMCIMLKNRATEPMCSLSCKEICDFKQQDCKVTTIYKHIRILEEQGLVKKGAKVERANGYILTQKAIDLLPTDTKLNKESAL